MESLTALASQSSVSPFALNPSAYTSSDEVIVKTLFEGEKDSVDVGVDNIYKSLSISTQKIISKINELLKDSLPDGVESLNADDFTPEKTAERITTALTARYDAFAKQHKDLSPEETIDLFMSELRKGVDAGYSDAYETLKGLGAFDIDGIEDGTKETKRLIDEKLAAFEDSKRKELGLESKLEKSATESVKTEILKQAGTGAFGLDITV